MNKGYNRIGHTASARGTNSFQAVNPATDQTIPGTFHSATKDEVELALHLAKNAFTIYRRTPNEIRVEFLDTITDNLIALEEEIVHIACLETALPEARIRGELQRTTAQITHFSNLIQDNQWMRIQQNSIDKKSGIRKFVAPLGPVVIFGAGNFPLAFSTGGTDTISALAAGNTVIVKAHPDHPGTSEIVGVAILDACKKLNLPEGTFSLLYDNGHNVGKWLVQHPSTMAVGFTGSERGGRALFDLANSRSVPIPVFAEMGSINPVLILPKAIQNRAEEIADLLYTSITMGCGQFCTNPGLLLIAECKERAAFIDLLRSKFEQAEGQTMLSKGIYQNYVESVNSILQHKDVQVSYNKTLKPEQTNVAIPVLAEANKSLFSRSKKMKEELFGPFSLVVRCKTLTDMEELLQTLAGQLSTTIFAEKDELMGARSLLDTMQHISGRVVYNEAPTGVQVCEAMHHGGPYPASTDSRFTAIGADAIRRFVRPVCFQNLPIEVLPTALQES